MRGWFRSSRLRGEGQRIRIVADHSVEDETKRKVTAASRSKVSGSACTESARVSGFQQSIATEMPATGRKMVCFTAAGKRVWSSDASVSEAEMSTLTGLSTAVMGILERHGEEIQCATAGNSRIVCARRGQLVFVAVGSRCNEAYLAREIEFAYEAVLMSLTSRIHKVLETNPSKDVRELLGSTGIVLGRLEEIGRTRPDIFLGASRCLRLDPMRRAQLAHVLTTAKKISTSEGRERLVFAAVLCGDAVLSLLQPQATEDRSLRSSDVVLLSHFVYAQRSALAASESSWLPVCLPRFEERGYLHAFVAYLDQQVDLSIVLVAADDDPDTFETLRNVSKAIDNALDRDGVKLALEYTDRNTSGDADSLARSARAEHFVFVRRRPLAASDSTTRSSTGDFSSSAFLAEEAEGSLAQFLSSAAPEDHDWSQYHALGLRLRHGSALPQHVFPSPGEEVSGETAEEKAHKIFERPTLQKATLYSTTHARTYFALAGPSFELYATFASLAPPADLAQRTRHIYNQLREAESSFFFDPVVT